MSIAKRTTTVPEFASEVGIGLTTAWKLVRENRLPVLRVGKRVLVARDTVERFLTGEISA